MLDEAKKDVADSKLVSEPASYTSPAKDAEKGILTSHGGIPAVLKETWTVMTFAGHGDGHLCLSLNKGHASTYGKCVDTAGRARTD